MVKIFQSVKNTRAGSITQVAGNGNRTAGAGSHHNVFGDRSSITQSNDVTVMTQGTRVDIELPKGYDLYINGERVNY